MAERVRRDAEIAAKAAEGKSGAEIARETGKNERTVQRATKQRPAGLSGETNGRPAWQQKVDELETPEARAWGSALAALRKVCTAST